MTTLGPCFHCGWHKTLCFHGTASGLLATCELCLLLQTGDHQRQFWEEYPANVI